MVLDASLNGVMAFDCVRDEAGAIVDFAWTLSNQTACKMVGRSEQSLLGQRLLQLMPGNGSDGLFDRYVQVVETGCEATFDHFYGHPKEGVSASFKIHAVPADDGFVVTFVDTTEQMRARAALEREEEALRFIVDNATDMVSLHDADGVFAYVTPSCKRLLGWPPGELLGRALAGYVEPADRESIARLLGKALSEGEKPGSVVYRVRRNDGVLTWLETTGKTAKDGRVVCVTRDVSERIALEGRLHKLAAQDELTGLLNRRAFLERLNAELTRATRYQHPLAVLLLDLDKFKTINDAFGHHVGDQTLRHVAQIIRGEVRAVDVVARLGGEEFVVAFPETDEAAALTVAERIRTALHRVPVQSVQPRVLVTASIGIALAHPDSLPNELLQQADHAMYEAKKNGRNRVKSWPRSVSN